jgi:hypothetical protein
MEFEGREDVFHKFGSNLFRDGPELAANEAWCYFRVVDVWEMAVDDSLGVFAWRNLYFTTNVNGDEEL